jgi:acyl-CoA thioesterase YciA
MARSCSAGAARWSTDLDLPHRPEEGETAISKIAEPPDAVQPAPLDYRQPAIRIVMMPRDANYLGTIFGGVILSSLDLAGAIEAQRFTDHKLVTKAMNEVQFLAPVFVGDLVSFYAETVAIGKTSITVRVTVEAQRARTVNQVVRVTQAEIVYVAVDGSGKPVPVGS